MKRYLGFCPGQFGDLYMGTVAARALKMAEPGCHITYVISKAYHECAPLFIEQESIDSIKILHKEKDGFDEIDVKWAIEQKFNGVFNPMQDHDHSRPWWRERHQALESAYMHGLPIEGVSPKIKMTKWFKESPEFGDSIAFAPFPASYAGIFNDKALLTERANQIIDIIRDLGYRVLQVGHPNEPALDGAQKYNTNYFDSVKNILGCKLFIGGDSGLTWLMSGYDHPTLALYSNQYYGPEFIKNIQPINPNATYLNAPNVNEISLDLIEKCIENKLLL